MSTPSLEEQILRGLRAYMDDSDGCEFVIMSVRGSDNLYVQFARPTPDYVPLVGDHLYGEVVGDEYLAPEELVRLDPDALERLGFAMQEHGNYGQEWPLTADLPGVARLAGTALREGLAVEEYTPLVITTALGELKGADD